MSRGMVRSQQDEVSSCAKIAGVNPIPSALVPVRRSTALRIVVEIANECAVSIVSEA